MQQDLIAAVSKREPLWNSKNKYHKNVPILKKMWKEVAQEVNKDEKVVRTKWKNLRTYFYREIRREQRKTREDGDSDCTPTWQFYTQMMFLKEEILESQRGANADIEFLTCNSNEFAESPASVKLENISRSASRASSVESESMHEDIKQEITSDNDHSDEERKPPLLETETPKDKDDDLLFFESLLPYMKKIPLRNKLRLRSVIQDAILQQLPMENDENTSST
ncbi:uncharacterized protein LOC126373741 [Pectinophora gossypiella]|uniref:MADF domain-containing protein n=2 Tax=Pectinophora gossypiella TaxID=13191 RepID=A0A1E1WTJ6_PECGO|nr:uncharacterized protein LOC126373741 [Pectinophora gossypiella]